MFQFNSAFCAACFMRYLNEFDRISHRADIAQDKFHRMAVLSLAKETALHDMEAAGFYVNRELRESPVLSF